MTKTVLFIVADERSNAGERDYMKALSILINDSPAPDTNYFVYKVGEAKEGEFVGSARVLPVNDGLYGAVPRFSVEHLSDIKGNVHIVGVGSSTLDVALQTKEYIGQDFNEDLPEVSYITHLVKPEDEGILEQENVKVFAPWSRETGYRLISMDAVPHTNNLSSCMADYALFTGDERYADMRKMLDSDVPFAFAVLGAGFEDKTDKSIWYLYDQEEAFEHGRALGKAMAVDTALILVDGGPRNRTEENKYRQQNMDAFVQGYRQEQGGEVQIFTDQFVPGQPFNMIKVGYMLALKESCRAFFTNPEGFGTMGSAILHVDNQAELSPENRSMMLGMMPFAAQYVEPTGTHAENIEKYHKLGIAIVSIHGDDLEVKSHPEQAKTPVPQRDAAVQIVQALGLVSPAAPSIQQKLSPEF